MSVGRTTTVDGAKTARRSAMSFLATTLPSSRPGSMGLDHIPSNLTVCQAQDRRRRSASTPHERREPRPHPEPAQAWHPVILLCVFVCASFSLRPFSLVLPGEHVAVGPEEPRRHATVAEIAHRRANEQTTRRSGPIPTIPTTRRSGPIPTIPTQSVVCGQTTKILNCVNSSLNHTSMCMLSIMSCKAKETTRPAGQHGRQHRGIHSNSSTIDQSLCYVWCAHCRAFVLTMPGPRPWSGSSWAAGLLINSLSVENIIVKSWIAAKDTSWGQSDGRASQQVPCMIDSWCHRISDWLQSGWNPQTRRRSIWATGLVSAPAEVAENWIVLSVGQNIGSLGLGTTRRSGLAERVQLCSCMPSCHSISLWIACVEGWMGTRRRPAFPAGARQDYLSVNFRVDCSIAPKDGTWGQNDGRTWRQDSCRILCVSLNFRVDCAALHRRMEPGVDTPVRLGSRTSVTQFHIAFDGTWVPHEGRRSHQDSCRIFLSLNFIVLRRRMQAGYHTTVVVHTRTRAGFSVTQFQGGFWIVLCRIEACKLGTRTWSGFRTAGPVQDSGLHFALHRRMEPGDKTTVRRGSRTPSGWIAFCIAPKDGTWGQFDGQAWQQDSFRVDCIRHCTEGWNLGTRRRSGLAAGLLQGGLHSALHRRMEPGDKTTVRLGSRTPSGWIAFCIAPKDGTWGQDDGQAWQQASFRVDCSIAALPQRVEPRTRV